MSVVGKVKLLERYLHGKTQNANESLNGMIWQRAPKNRYIGFVQLELAVYDAIAHFNIGTKAILDIYNNMDILPG